MWLALNEPTDVPAELVELFSSGLEHFLCCLAREGRGPGKPHMLTCTSSHIKYTTLETHLNAVPPCSIIQKKKKHKQKRKSQQIQH